MDTSTLSDENVIGSMRGEEDRGIEDRKDMVDITERESEEATQRAQEAQENAVQSQQALEEQQEIAEQAQRDAKQAQQNAANAEARAQETEQNAAENPEDQAAQEEAEQAREEADQARQEAEAADANARQQEERANELAEETQASRDEAQEQQERADRLQQEAQSERDAIAQDQQELANEQLRELEDGTVVGLRVLDDTDYLGALVKVNATTGRLIRESPVKVIRGRTIVAVDDAIEVPADATTSNTSEVAGTSSAGFVAICGETGGIVRLCLLDANNMEIQKESEEIVSEHSVLAVDAGIFYCVIQDGEDWVIGKYDKTLTLLLKSTEKVSQFTAITVTAGGLVVSGVDGSPMLLSLSDMSQITE